MKIMVFGEILWDVFADDKHIGGAPLNFCAHMTRLGAEGCLVSAIGDDELGAETKESLRRLKLSTDYISTAFAPTGICNVTVDASGTPAYELVKGVAYDYIDVGQAAEDIGSGRFDALYFGTLAQRGAVSREALGQLIARSACREIFCDINIRQNFYNEEVLRTCLDHATILKISTEEYDVFDRMGITDVWRTAPFGSREYSIEMCRRLARVSAAKLIIVTMNKDGAMLYSTADDRAIFSKKPESKAVSTVGGGDSFGACFLYNYLLGAPLTRCLNCAVELSDFVVTQQGAVPDYPDGLLRRIVAV